MFSPNPAPSTAGSGYTRARTPQGGMSPTALSALFPTATTGEGLTATEVASQTFVLPATESQCLWFCRLPRWASFRRLFFVACERLPCPL